MSFLAAFRFLTSLPLGRHDVRPEQLGRATTYFPVVGLVIGIILAVLYWLLGMVLPRAVVSALLLVVLVMITGALHLDGFVDTCDALAGQKTVEERWRVMRDSRAGAFGIVGVVLLLLVKYVSLNSIPEPFIFATLVFMPVVARWAMAYAIFAFPYARPSGLGTVFKQAIRWYGFTAATVITIAVALALYPVFSLGGLLFMFGIWVVTLILSVYLKHKFSGLTGDTYGAINEVAEAMVLVFASLLAYIIS